MDENLGFRSQNSINSISDAGRGAERDCRKQYSIEQRDGEKVVSRRQGFTVSSCVTGVAAAQPPALAPRPTSGDVEVRRNQLMISSRKRFIL